ncbi:glycosyltransferase family 4 protein [Miltoncostaea marina]|uniref:glycosyltransferase family 4 protein n=1 Tax=Miltoncostaea marina TaxID=2843215 RepID=UPI001C3C9498|nr:glycosyltransferase family 4 protein [Miltoncostaea marina]
MPARTALHVLVFFPRGGSAQVVRYLARHLPRGDDGWRARVVAGSLGAPGEPTHAAGFFGEDVELVAVPYDDAVRAPDPVMASPPMHPSYEERPGAPDRVFASLDDAAYGHHVAAWRGILGAPGVLDGVEVAHLHHLTPAHEALVRLAPGLPVVTHLHGTELAMLQRIEAGAPWAHGPAWAERMRRWAARSSRVVASSTAAVRLAEELLGMAPGSVGMVPNGVDPAIFDGARAAPGERAAVWRRWLADDPRGWTPEDRRPGAVRYDEARLAPLLDPDAVVVLFVGRFTAVKRAPLLVRAHARARACLGRPLPLVLWGGSPGEWEGEHPAHAAAASPAGHEVFFTGWRGHHELARALACADVLAVPSVAEKFGQVYLEAMAMGVPPIACDAEGPPTFIEGRADAPARAGWLVAPDDEEALAAALVAAAGDPAERALRGANGRRLVAARYTWPAIAPRVAAIYDEVAGPV